MKHLMWFRADLRTIDNTALTAACQHPQAEVVGLYFISAEQWQKHHTAGCKVEFELATVQQLSNRLQQLNIPLIVINSLNFNSQITDLVKFCQKENITHVFYNKQYEINELQRDAQIEQQLRQLNVQVSSFDDQCIVTPSRVLTNDGRFYTVFTPFKKTWLQHIQQNGIQVLTAPQARKFPSKQQATAIPSQLNSFSSHISQETAQLYWPAGEEAALKRLDIFCQHHIRGYKDNRDYPLHPEGTSRLSPYLAVGSISARQCFQAAINEQQAYGHSDGIDCWISELAWRDFYKHLMVAYPHLCKHKAFKVNTDNIVWRHDQADFQRWCEGKTGFPIVDAAMRQLNTIGWMHNRLRMVTAMFLTKDLFIDWRWGERYFMEHLIDGDLAANNGGWQWSASTGNDAAPYFRIFNPALQSQKFDANGDFIRRYVPEIAHLDSKTIHEPHGKQRQLFLDYPLPMVNHKQACAFAVEQFEKIKAT